MLYNIKIFLFILSTLVLTNCGYNFAIYKNYPFINNNFKNIIFYNLDSYDLLAKNIKSELTLHKINFIKENLPTDMTNPTIHIINVFENINKIATLQNSTLNKFQFILKIQAKIIIDSITYDIYINTQQFFFSNILIPLTQDSEIKCLREELYQQATKQLINKIFTYF